MQMKTRIGTMSILKRNLKVLCLAWTLTSCGGAQQNTGGDSSEVAEAATVPEITEKTPVVGDFSLKDVDGNLHALSDYLGKKVIVISYFATWCQPCRKELVELEKLYQTYKDRDVLILAVAMDLPETRSEVRPLVKKQGFTFPVLLDVDLKAADLFNPKREAPFGLVIDLEKNRIWSHMGYVPGDEKTLESVILSALEKPPAASEPLIADVERATDDGQTTDGDAP